MKRTRTLLGEAPKGQPATYFVGKRVPGAPERINMQALPAAWPDAMAREVTIRYNTHDALVAALRDLLDASHPQATARAKEQAVANARYALAQATRR